MRLPLTRNRPAISASPHGRGELSFSQGEKVPEGRMRGTNAD